MSRIIQPNRRQIVAGAAAAGLGAAIWTRPAAAQAKGKIVVGTWGGDYARLLNKNIDIPILIKEGWEVVQDQAGDSLKDAGRGPPAARHVGRAGPFSHQHVPDA
jgi:hypothetical protein